MLQNRIQAGIELSISQTWLFILSMVSHCTPVREISLVCFISVRFFNGNLSKLKISENILASKSVFTFLPKQIVLISG